MKKSMIKLVAVAGAMSTLVACSSAAAPETPGQSDNDIVETPDAYVIGIATSASGWMASYDEPAERAARMAVEDINASGGINGVPLEVLFMDTKTDQQVAATAAQQLIADGAQVLLASSDFDYGSPTALAAQAEDVVTISIGAASPLFGQVGIGDLAFTTGTPTPTLGASAAEWAKGEGWGKAIALCDISIDYSTSLCNDFQASFQALGGDVVGIENFQQDDVSIAQQINSMQGMDGDFIYLGSYLPGGAAAIRQIRSSGIDIPIVSGAALEGTDWLDSVPNLSDFYFTSVRFIHGPGEGAGIENFVKKYEETYGEAPEHSDVLVGYIAVELIAEALRNNGGDISGPALADALNALDGAETLIGAVTFAPGMNFSLEREMSVIRVNDGQMEFVTHVTPSQVPEPQF